MLALAVLSACADAPSSPTAPGKQPVDRAALRDLLRSATQEAIAAEGNAAHIAAYVDGDSGTYRVMLDPTVPFSELIGPHYVTIPANTVCELASTAYGPEHWESDCQPQTEPFEMTATWAVVNGHASITFSPDLRFRPSGDSANWILLSMKDPNVTMDSDVLWNHNGQWVNESASDSALLPYVDPASQRVTRRLKHFSGYQVWGLTDEAPVAY